MMEERYIDINIDFSKFIELKIDIRVPVYLSLKEILQILVQNLNLNLEIVNPIARVVQTQKVISALSSLEQINEDRNGVILFIEEK